MVRRRRKTAPGADTKGSPADVSEVLPDDGKRSKTQRTEEERIIRQYKERITGPISGIRAHCIECFGAQVRAVSNCPSTECALYPFRMGVNTLHKRSKAQNQE